MRRKRFKQNKNAIGNKASADMSLVVQKNFHLVTEILLVKKNMFCINMRFAQKAFQYIQYFRDSVLIV